MARLAIAVEDALGRAMGFAGGPDFPMTRSALPAALASRIAEPGKELVIVIDYFHKLRDPDGRSLVACFCDLLPPKAYLLLTSREGLLFPVACPRARGEPALGVSAPMIKCRNSPTRTCRFLSKNKGLDLL